MPDIITNHDASYAYDIVERICQEVGPGLPGSIEEHKRAAIIKEELEKHLGKTNVKSEEFKLAPRAYLSAYPISALFMLIAALFNMSMGFFKVSPWVSAILAFLFAIFSILSYTIEFAFCLEFLDPLFRKKESVNVIGSLVKPETNTVKRLVIFCGHHDSAFENTWLRFLGYGFFILSGTFFIGLATITVMSILQLSGLIVNKDNIVRFGTIGWVLFAFLILPAVLFGIFFSRGWKNGGNVPGAADNLSGTALVVAMARFLVNNPAYIPLDTEIRFLSFGSEEAGVRGSKRYVKRHFEELKRLDAQIINFETVSYPEISILTSEINGTKKNSPAMVQSVVDAAKRAGVPFKVKPALIGTASDAGPFSRAGLKAVTLLPFKIPQQMVAFYHQKWDRPDVLSTEALYNVLSLSLEWIKRR